MEQHQTPNMYAARSRHRNSHAHGWRIFWSVFAGACWLIPVLVWVPGGQHIPGHPLRLFVGMFVTAVCVYVVPFALRRKEHSAAEQPGPQPSLSSTYEQGYRKQSAGAATEIPDDVPPFQSRSIWQDEQPAIDYPELPLPQ